MPDSRSLPASGRSRSLKSQLFLIAGQSNAAGAGEVADLTPPYDQPQDDVLLFDWENWVPLAPGYGIGDPPPNDRHGLELSLGHSLGRSRSGDVRIVKGTAANTSLAEGWNPQGGTLYNLLIQLVHTAAAAIEPRGRPLEVSGFLWMQGEDDAKRRAHADAYAQNLVALIAALRTDLRQSRLPVVVGRISSSLPPDRFGFKDTVRAAQVQVADDDPDVQWVDTDDLSDIGDDIHFDSRGLVRLGRRMAGSLPGQTPIEPSS